MERFGRVFGWGRWSGGLRWVWVKGDLMLVGAIVKIFVAVRTKFWVYELDQILFNSVLKTVLNVCKHGDKQQDG